MVSQVALVLASSTGGIGRHVLSLAIGLVGAGYSVTVYGPVATEKSFGFARVGARFVPVAIPAGPRPGDAVVVRTLGRALRTDPPAVIHAHGLRAGMVAGLARPSTVPLVVTWHNLVLTGGLRGRMYRRVEGYVARAADVTLGASADLVARARDLGATDARLAAVAAPTLPPPTRNAAEVRAELGVAPSQPLVLSVGRLHPQKGYDLLVAAAATWVGPRPYVAIAGAGPAHQDLTKRISAVRAPVHLLGHRDDVAELLASADVAVVTSVWEARQIFAQEALRAGVPLVATSVGGIPELVGDAALLVAPHDVEGIAEAVGRLLVDPALRREYAARGVARAATWPTVQDTLHQVTAVYGMLLAGRGQR